MSEGFAVVISGEEGIHLKGVETEDGQFVHVLIQRDLLAQEAVALFGRCTRLKHYNRILFWLLVITIAALVVMVRKAA